MSEAAEKLEELLALMERENVGLWVSADTIAFIRKGESLEVNTPYESKRDYLKRVLSSLATSYYLPRVEEWIEKRRWK